MATVDPNALACARAILGQGVSAADAIIFVAIAGCESSYGTNNYTDHGYNGPYDCHGARSYGAWQINMEAHYPYLRSVTNSSNPCTWASWLMNVDHNAEAAVHVWRSAGTRFTPWTTYNDGCYRANLTEATAAVAAAVGSTSGTPPGQATHRGSTAPSPAIPQLPQPSLFATIAPELVLVGAILGGAMVVADLVKKARQTA